MDNYIPTVSPQLIDHVRKNRRDWRDADAYSTLFAVGLVTQPKKILESFQGLIGENGGVS